MIVGAFKWGMGSSSDWRHLYGKWELCQVFVAGMTGNELCGNIPGRLSAGAFRVL